MAGREDVERLVVFVMDGRDKIRDAKERIAHVIFHATPNGHVNNEKILKRGRCLRCDAGGIGGGVDDELLLLAVKGSVSKGELRLLLVDCVLDATSCSSFSRSASWELLAS